jgi:hypothetical protein
MDIWFPWLVVISGLILVLPMQSEKLRAKARSIHPLGKSGEKMEAQGWLFIIVGCLWCLQNLLVA